MVADIAYLQQSQQEINQLEALFARQRAAYLAQPMPDATQRVQWLKALRDLLFKEQQALIEAIDRDFSARSADETLLAEIMPSLHGIHYAAKRVKKWMKPARRAVGLQFQPASAQVVYQPLGVVGVIVPWNYPLFLSIGPLTGALAAGNRVMIKMSESTPATGRLLKDLLARIFPEALVPLFAEGQQRRLPQTLLLNVSDDMKVMQEEIFGPLLPVIPYERLEDALAYVNQRPRPLALYYFGYDKAQQQRVLHETHSGGVCLNDTLLHVAQDDIPFGGVGPSGMGHYHGHEGFLTFSKAKGVFSKPRFNAARMIYPPYGKSIQKLVYKLFVR